MSKRIQGHSYQAACCITSRWSRRACSRHRDYFHPCCNGSALPTPMSIKAFFNTSSVHESHPQPGSAALRRAEPAAQPAGRQPGTPTVSVHHARGGAPRWCPAVGRGCAACPGRAEGRPSANRQRLAGVRFFMASLWTQGLIWGSKEGMEAAQYLGDEAAVLIAFKLC